MILTAGVIVGVLFLFFILISLERISRQLDRLDQRLEELAQKSKK
jgi:uncharacterized membrane protein YciS (DUF1049 family)